MSTAAKVAFFMIGLAIGMLAVVTAVGVSQHSSPLEHAERNWQYVARNDPSMADLCQAAQQGKAAAISSNADDITYIIWRDRVVWSCSRI